MFSLGVERAFSQWDGQEYGRLYVQSLATFHGRPAGLLEEALEFLAIKARAPLPAASITDWPRITQCINRGVSFSVAAEIAGTRMFLSFTPDTANVGDYEIRAPHERRYEKGRVLSAVAVDEEALCTQSYLMLVPFEFRYIVITSAHDRQGTQRLWRIGFSSPRVVSIDEDSIAENA